MPRSVSIKAGQYNVELPNGQTYNATNPSGAAGPTIILTDEEWAKIGLPFTSVLVDNGNVGTSTVTTQAAHVAAASAATAVAVATTSPTNTTPYGFSTSAQAAALVTGVNALITDVAAIRTTLNNELAALQVAGGAQLAS